MAADSSADGRSVTTRRLPLAVLAAVLAVVSLAAPAAPAEEAPPDTAPTTTTTTLPPGVVLAPPGADEAGRRQAQADLKTTQAALKKAISAQRVQARRMAPLETRKTQLFQEIVHLEAQDRAATEALLGARDRVRKLAVAGYVVGGDVPPVDYLLRATSPSDFVRRHSLVKSATRSKADALDAYQEAKSATSDALLATVEEADRVNAQAAQVAQEVAVAAQLVDTLRAEVDHRKQMLDVLTAAAPVGTSDIPRLFLDAYRRAAAALAKRVPHCRVGWTAIAAIGKVESNHGRYRGAQLALNGDVYPRILGIPLDGTRGTRLIKDTDQGVLDLDQVYDRAVGPMQFIPSTWKRIGQDANADGVKEANNAYDAAMATAAYLCRAVPAGGLDTDEALRKAFFSYNHSDAYVEYVLGWKHTFDALAATV